MLTTSSRRRMKRVLAVEAEPEMSLREPSAVSRLYRHVTHSATSRYLHTYIRGEREHTKKSQKPKGSAQVISNERSKQQIN